MKIGQIDRLIHRKLWRSLL